MSDYLGVLDRAFAPDVEVALLGSVELALQLGVAAAEVLDSDEKVLAYFLDWCNAPKKWPGSVIPAELIPILERVTDPADDYDPIREVRTQITEQVRDQVIPLDSAARDTELRSDRSQSVGVHCCSSTRACIRISVVRIF